VLGVGYSNDAHHLVAPEPTGAGAATALRRALVEAGVGPDQVGYVNAHGTATALNDEAEASGLYEVFGAAARALPVSSTKGATGHTMGAASATEAIATVLALHRGLLPPTTGLEEPDPDLGLNVIQSEPLHVEVDVALSSGYGFGGNNAVLALARSARETPLVGRREVFIHSGAALVGESLGLAQVWDRLTLDTLITADGEATFEPAAVLGKKGLRHVDRGALLLASALETDLSGWPVVDKLRAGAVFGSAFPAYSSVLAVLRAFQKGGAKSVNPMLVPFATSNCAPSWWLMRRGITGYNGSVGSGGCAGLDAILLAAMQVRRGRIDVAVAGGVEAKTEELWHGLRNLGWVDGPISEAVGAVALSSDGAGAWCRLAGAAAAFEPMDPEGALGRAVAEALAASGLQNVDLTVAGRSPRLDLPSRDLIALEPYFGETLGVSGALAVLVGAMHAAQSAAPAQSVLALALSPEGYASAAVLEAVSLS
jgi:3-oxoacyl-(acyl-carrier-protein) synthase